jgi:hypothetical protein
MLWKKFITHCEGRIATSFSSSNADNHGSLGADQEHTLETWTFTYDAGLLSAMLQH